MRIKHNDKIMMFLEIHPWSTVLEMSTSLRISNVGARLSELRKMGAIKQYRDSITDPDGHTTYFNRYAVKESKDV